MRYWNCPMSCPQRFTNEKIDIRVPHTLRHAVFYKYFFKYRPV